MIAGAYSSAQSVEQYTDDTYYSPDTNVRANIIKAIDEATSTIDLAVYDLTSKDIRTALLRANDRGVQIRIIADNVPMIKNANSLIKLLIDDGFSVKLVHGVHGGIMHNKFCIFDQKFLFTGSFNWTDKEEQNNYENALFLADPRIIEEYQKEFSRVWALGNNNIE